eukprot:scaffold9743_cov38-Phaeocystis_antarctica.AAC.1
MKAARSISHDASGVLWLSAGSLSEVMVEVEELEAVRSRAHIPPKVEVEVEVEVEAGRAACISVSLKGLGSQPPPVVSRHAVRTVQYEKNKRRVPSPEAGTRAPEADRRVPSVRVARLRHGCGTGEWPQGGALTR